MKKRNGLPTGVFYGGLRQLLYMIGCVAKAWTAGVAAGSIKVSSMVKLGAVRAWAAGTAAGAPSLIAKIRDLWGDRFAVAPAPGGWLKMQGAALCRLLLAAAACSERWVSEARAWMTGDALRAVQGLRSLPSRLKELPSLIGRLPAALIGFYSGGRPERAAAFKGWLAEQAGVSRALLAELVSQVRLWGLEAWDWARHDALCGYGTAKRRLYGLLSSADDLRTGKLQVDWRHLVNRPVAAAALAGFLLVCGNLYLTESRLTYATVYDGREIGLVASRQAGEAVRVQVQKDLEQRVGKSVFLPGVLGYRTCMASRTLLSSTGELADAIRSLPWMTEGELIIVNQKPLLAVADKAVAQQLLEQVKALYVQKHPGEEIREASFRDDVALLRQQVPVSQVAPAEAALAALRQDQVQQDHYTVRDGDSLWSIARSHDLLVADLLKANPQLASTRLQIGQDLQLNTAQPLLGVIVTSQLVARVAIPRPVQSQPDGSMYSGQTRVLQAGADGEAEVTYQVVRLNEQELKRDEIARKVLKQPQPRLVAQGTQRTVAYAGTASRGSGSGVLSWPVSGSISSPFGYRGGGFHTGIDICTSYGTPVGAAAAGKVILAGWSGGYGNCVLIDHGDGLATRYAHLSKILVSSGEMVSKGEVIGNVGQTGNATGSHLHFEVISNGNVQNPLRFLR